MTCFNPYEAPRGDLARPPHASTPTCLGSCLITAAGIFIGFVLGGAYGFWNDGVIAKEMARRGEVVDFIPFGIPIFGSIGAILGGVLTALFRALGHFRALLARGRTRRTLLRVRVLLARRMGLRYRRMVD
jgi:hypothetical protein